MSWNIFKLTIGTSRSTGTSLKPVLEAMIKKASREIAAESCVLMTIKVKDFTDDETLSYPLDVFNIDEDPIGTAANTAEYISVWNSDNVNRTRGFIKSGTGTTFKVQPVYINIVPPLYGEEA